MKQSQLSFPGYVLLSDALSTIISDDEAKIPLRLAYAMTDNNCEGQMMKRVLLGISNPPLPTDICMSRCGVRPTIKISAESCVIQLKH
jgi:hypothetical protein